MLALTIHSSVFTFLVVMILSVTGSHLDSYNCSQYPLTCASHCNVCGKVSGPTGGESMTWWSLVNKVTHL